LNYLNQWKQSRNLRFFLYLLKQLCFYRIVSWSSIKNWLNLSFRRNLFFFLKLKKFPNFFCSNFEIIQIDITNPLTPYLCFVKDFARWSVLYELVFNGINHCKYKCQYEFVFSRQYLTTFANEFLFFIRFFDWLL
jgi:hypothetical protein